MGTTRSNLYLNTSGDRENASDFVLMHSVEGTFKKRLPKHCKNGENPLRLASGGHGEEGRKLLDKYGIEYNIIKTYPNGVRIGNLPDSKIKRKQKGGNMSWFPASWDRNMINNAGKYVAILNRNTNSKDGKKIFGIYEGVRVGVILTNGKIGTIFPDTDQNNI